MTKTTSIAMIAGLTLWSTVPAYAQAPSDPKMFVSVSGGGQFQNRTLDITSTFNLFGEDGTVRANQTVGSGFVFDASVGRRIWRRLSVAVGVSTFHGIGEAAALVAVPDPLHFGRPTTKTFQTSDYGDLSQTDIAINFQAVWIKPLTDKIDLWLFAGPSVIRVKQEVASATETPDAAPAVKSEAKVTGKAGTAGVDLSYRLANRYSVGAFVRYGGGQVDLPSVRKLKVGGLQLGIGARIRF